ncbi:hypothetical protein ACJ5H2_04830 [Nocardioides sp. R1-1]|uniref:hypothetical protein n=1 Tax=Nocardioides sp. R1-1 TaxID=3383502 RepID=UPI0038D1A073
MHAAVATVVSVLAAKDKPVDQDTNIVAGWTAFWIFVALIAAVAVIGWALTRSLRTAQRAKDAGVYGDEPAADPDTDSDSPKDS